MTTYNHEGLPDSAEIATPVDLARACVNIAEASHKYASHEVEETKLGYMVTDGDATTFEWSFTAEHSERQADGTPGHLFTFNLTASQLIESTTEELEELMRQKGDAIPEEVDGVEIEYDLQILLRTDGTLKWDEERSYDVWIKSEELPAPTTDLLSEEVELTLQHILDAKVEPKPNYVHYHKSLDCNMEAADDEAQDTEDEVSQQARDFERLLGEAGLSKFFSDEYFAKALKIFYYCLAGRDADVQAEDCFPADVIAQIRAA